MRTAAATVEDRAIRGWVTAELAAYQHRLDPVQAQTTLRSAKALNRQVTTPMDGVTYSRLDADLSDQAGRCLGFLRDRFPTGNALVIHVNALADRLRFAPDTEPAFVRAVVDLGELIGFEAQRPEADFGRGPDDLWKRGNLQFAIIEAKNGATTARVSKTDCNQLAGSANWFANEYDRTCNATAIIIHPSAQTNHDATPPPGGRCMDVGHLAGLVAAVRRFAAAVATKPQFGTVPEIARLLAELGLSAATLVERHTVSLS